MGDRAQVHMQDTGVFLYTHFDGSNLEEIVRDVLKRKKRWSDPRYLARMIFDAMIGDDQGSENGYGIDTNQCNDVNFVIEINTSEKIIRITNGGDKKYTFDEFIGIN